MNLKISYLLSCCFFLFSCSPAKENREQPKEVLEIKQDSLSNPKTKVKLFENTKLKIEDSFVLKINADSINAEINPENYEQLPKEVSNKISVSLGKEVVREESKSSKFYKYKTIVINEKMELNLITNGAKFGYNSIFASLINIEQEAVLKSVLIAQNRGDVGDLNIIHSKIICEGNQLILGVYKKYLTDDFLMGNSDGMYKVHHDSLLLYEIKADGMILKAAKSGI
ncbi:MAG: hypothetical protein AB8G15_21965 [Saprospiraceae bacterium]